MTETLLTTVVSTGGSVIVGVAGMWIVNSQLAKRLDRLEDQFHSFKDVVNGKLSALDLEIAKLLDKK